MNDCLVCMINEHIFVWSILLAEEHNVNTELRFQFLLQFLLVGTYITVFL